MPSLQDLVEEWLRLDQNDKTRQEIQSLWNSGDVEELEKRLRFRIEFGTAGLRGKMEAGWSRMNDLIVIQTSQGLCAYLKTHVLNASSRGIIIGHDHRYNSERWAKLTAAAFVANGVKSYLFSGAVHTPIVPFSVKRLGTACGVMITASHNPKQDNGYKVYWENAAQITVPHDEGISRAIRVNLDPQVWSVDDLTTSPLCIDVTAKMYAEYFQGLAKLCLSNDLNATCDVKFVNTSMHGVSDRILAGAFNLLGFPPYLPVREQQLPDPEFPTVLFPNPEEEGALNLAIQTANAHSAQYVLAQDPDSDRFTAAEKSDGQWTVFTGDQLGAIFAHHIFRQYKASGKPTERLAMVASTVSSKMVEAIAKKEGFKFVECLTGFKHIGNTALDLVNQEYDVPFGYEEAIGYMFGSQIPDKDGVAATVVFAGLVASLRQRGGTVKGYLGELYDHYGYFQTSNSYFFCTDPVSIDRIFMRLRSFNGSSNSVSYPKDIAGLNVTSVVDLTTGYDSRNPPTFAPSLPLSSGHMIQFRAENAENGTRIVLTIRTSGTEPKIKYYLEGSGKDIPLVSSLLPTVVAELREVWLEAGRHNPTCG